MSSPTKNLSFDTPRSLPRESAWGRKPGQTAAQRLFSTPAQPAQANHSQNEHRVQKVQAAVEAAAVSRPQENPWGRKPGQTAAQRLFSTPAQDPRPQNEHRVQKVQAAAEAAAVSRPQENAWVRGKPLPDASQTQAKFEASGATINRLTSREVPVDPTKLPKNPQKSPKAASSRSSSPTDSGIGSSNSSSAKSEKSPALSLADRDILILGDGNFTYTEYLVEKHRVQDPNFGQRVIATEYYSEQEIYTQDPKIRITVSKLKKLGVVVLFNIDATKINEEFKPNRFVRIQFNCPDVPANPKERLTAKMIYSFFAAAKHVLDPRGRIHMAAIAGRQEPQAIGDRVQYIGVKYGFAEAILGNEFVAIEKIPFKDRGKYTHKKTGCKQSADSAQSKEIHEYVFQDKKNPIQPSKSLKIVERYFRENNECQKFSCIEGKMTRQDSLGVLPREKDFEEEVFSHVQKVEASSEDNT